MRPASRDWLIVVAVAVAFLAVPVAIVLNPPSLPFRFTYLVLPIIPAVALAVFGLWYALSPRE